MIYFAHRLNPTLYVDNTDVIHSYSTISKRYELDARELPCAFEKSMNDLKDFAFYTRLGSSVIRVHKINMQYTDMELNLISSGDLPPHERLEEAFVRASAYIQTEHIKNTMRTK